MEVVNQDMLQALRRGDERAWQTFFSQVDPLIEDAVKGYLRQRGLPLNLAPDLAQDIRVKVWRNIQANKCPQNGDFTRNGLKVWITNILRNWSPKYTAQKLFNARLHSSDGDSSGAATDAITTIRNGERHEIGAYDKAMLWVELEAALSPGEYKLLRNLCNGQSFQDIARNEQVSEASVRKRWRKLQEKLQTMPIARELARLYA